MLDSANQKVYNIFSIHILRVLKGDFMISDRQKLILKAIVEEFVRTNEPVGSKTLTDNEHFALNVSPATIRNEMAILEEMGLIVKTHTSSGRIPSEDGYKLYVQGVLNEKNSVENFPLIDEIFEKDLISREEAIKESVALVSDITNYAALVLGASSYNARIKKLQFVSLTQRHAVILIVTDQGYVESKKIIVPDEVNVSEMDKIITILNDILHDCPISEIDKRIKEHLEKDNMSSFIAYYEKFISALTRVFTEMVQDKFFLSGQSNILNQPEFQNVSKAKEILNVIENQEILKAVNVTNAGISVKIGGDNQIHAMKDCTVITVPYELDDGKTGAIAVIGPTRMHYQKVIPLLEYIAKNIKKVVD